ncbi:hypothetical protein DY000_02054058, partial [Brassica cretica]
KKQKFIMKTQSQPLEARRSANYRPSLWEHENLLLLGNKYAKEDKIERAKLLKQEVSRMLDETEGLLEQLELVDNLQRLGISYHFEREIKKILTNVHVRHVGHRKRVDRKRSEDLYATALKFRLLRQHGFNIAQDVFGCFFGDGLDDEDIKSVLSLYEASYLSTRFDTKLKKTIYYTTTRLKKFVEMKNNETTSYVRKMVIRALEMPYHRRVRRLEARWYIDVYGETHDTNPNLLELAKLDFNFVQVIHQDELKSLSRPSFEKTGQENKAKKMPASEPFKPVKAMAVDLYPHTHYCEMVMLFNRSTVGGGFPTVHLVLPCRRCVSELLVWSRILVVFAWFVGVALGEAVLLD